MAALYYEGRLLNAYVRLNEVEQGPAYFQTTAIKTITSYGSGCQMHVGDDFQRYTLEETPDEVYKLIQEAEADRILKVDEIEDLRSQAIRERTGAAT